MFQNLKLQTKLLFALLSTGLLAISITGWQSYKTARDSLERFSFDKLTAIRETKKRQIETYFSQIKYQIITLSEDEMIIEAARQFKTAFHNIRKEEKTDHRVSEHAHRLKNFLKGEFTKKYTDSNILKSTDPEKYLPEEEETLILQAHYIAENPNPIGFKDLLDMANDGGSYSRLHVKYHPIIRSYLKKFGYYDIFLADEKTGHIVYSVSKEIDFATSLLTGPFRETNIAKAFQEAQNASQKDFVKLVDFERYYPSCNTPASFIASPIFDGDEKVGVLLFQIPSHEINRVMTGDRNWKQEGLGESGETYLVGSDFKMRSDSRFLIDQPRKYLDIHAKKGTDVWDIAHEKDHLTSILSQEVRTEAARNALEGHSETKIVNDYREIAVLSSYAPLDIDDVQWAILSEIDKDEAFAPIQSLRKNILMTTLFILLLVAAYGFWISRAISTPVRLLTKGVKEFGKGDFAKRVPTAHSKDEIGTLAVSFNEMADNLLRTTVSKGYMDNILTSMTDALLVASPIDPNISAGWPAAIITAANRAAIGILNYAEDELIGHPIGTVFSGEDLLKRDWFEELLQKELVCDLEKTWVTKEGKAVPVLFSASVLRDPKNGAMQGMVCVAHDYTQRKQAEDALRKIATGVTAETGEKFFTLMVQHLAETLNVEFAHIAELVSEEKETVRTIAAYYNGARVKNYEYSLADTPCQNVLKKGYCFYPQGVTELFPRDAALKEMGVVSYAGIPLVNSAGQTRGVMVAFGRQPLGNQEIARSMMQVFAVRAAAELERKRAEDALRKAKEEAVEATMLKDKFISLLAHDLRGPFATILGFLKLVLKDTEQPLHPNHHMLIEKVVAKGEELLGLIKELLELSRLKAGKLTPRRLFLDAHFVASHIATDMKPLAEKKGIELINEVPHETRLYADPHLFNQVMENLVSNAIKFCGEGDTVTIFVPTEEKSCLAVQDTGVGIEENRRATLFKYEERTSSIGTSGERGTGLGLPLCRDIMAAHGGTLDFQSTPGHGTIFYARLPWARPQVMVVDDDADIRLGIRCILELMGTEILEADNGRDALDQLSNHHPHLIILDLKMREMDGFEFLRLFRNSPSHQDIPVIVLTADNLEESRNRAFQMGANDFIKKPTELTELKARVRRFIG